MEIRLHPDDIDRIARRVVEIQRETPEVLTLSAADAMKMLGCKSTAAFYRETAALKLRPYRFGKYLTREVRNAVAKKSLRAQEGTRVGGKP